MAPGLSNAELDRLSGLQKSHTRALETKTDPNPELRTLQAIAATLGTTVGYLANGEGDGPTPRAVRDSVNARRVLYARENRRPIPLFDESGAIVGHEPLEQGGTGTEG